MNWFHDWNLTTFSWPVRWSFTLYFVSCINGGLLPDKAVTPNSSSFTALRSAHHHAKLGTVEETQHLRKYSAVTSLQNRSTLLPMRAYVNSATSRLLNTFEQLRGHSSSWILANHITKFIAQANKMMIGNVECRSYFSDRFLNFRSFPYFHKS